MALLSTATLPSLFFSPLSEMLYQTSSDPQNKYPPSNIVSVSKEGEDTVGLIEIALAGWKKENIEIEVDKRNILSVRGKSETVSGDEGVTYVTRQIAKRSFNRSWRLHEHVYVRNATFENGLLVIELAKHVPELEQPKLIPIASKS